jgi:cytochrome c5
MPATGNGFIAMPNTSTRLLALLPIPLVLSACISGPPSGPAAAAAAGNRSGEVVYRQACSDCHAAGEANAPKFGDRERWKELIEEGQDVLTAHAWVGVRAMPPRGGHPDLSLAEFARATAFMARAAGGDWQDPDQAMLDRIRHEERKRLEETAAKVQAPVAGNRSGEAVYKQVCEACHASGVAGAPKFADRADWTKLIEEGQDVLTAHAWVGVRAMPPRGGSSELSLAEFARATAFMARAAGGDWQDPDAALLGRIRNEEKKRVEEMEKQK